MAKVGLSWNGTNETQILEKLIREGKSLASFPNPTSSQWALLSQEEFKTVKNVVTESIRGRLVLMCPERSALRCSDDKSRTGTRGVKTVDLE